MNYLSSRLLENVGFRHAFFTRQGGVSEGTYASLNFSYGVGDQSTRVDENFHRAEAALDLEPGRLIYVAQVHGAAVCEVTGSETRDTMRHTQGDALSGESPGIGLGVRTADCVPVLVADPTGGRATAIHAGWRGMVRGVIGAALATLGGRREQLVVAIGPHIEVGAFEVSSDVARDLEACSSAPAAVLRRAGAKPHVDLRAIARAQLESLGVPTQNVDDVAGCTVSQPQLFFSYRRDGKASGRHISVIVPRGR